MTFSELTNVMKLYQLLQQSALYPIPSHFVALWYKTPCNLDGDFQRLERILSPYWCEINFSEVLPSRNNNELTSLGRSAVKGKIFTVFVFPSMRSPNLKQHLLSFAYSFV